MNKNMTQLVASIPELKDTLELAKRVTTDSIANQERKVVALAKDALAGHMERWPPQTPTGDDLIKFANSIVQLVPTLDEVKASRQ